MKKTLLIILSCSLFLLIILMFLVNRSSSSYLIFDSRLFLKYGDDNFEIVSSDELFNRDYHTFYQKEYIGKYEVYNADVENKKVFFTNSESSEAYTFDTPYLAVTSEIEYLPFEAVSSSSDDLSYLTYDLDKYFIESVDDLDIFEKVVYDFDLDGEDESIFVASYWNEVDDGLDLETSFSTIFLVDNGIIYSLGYAEPYPAYEYEDDSFFTMDSFSLGYLFDIDDSIRIVVSMKSTDVVFYSIYEFNGNDLVCQFDQY